MFLIGCRDSHSIEITVDLALCEVVPATFSPGATKNRFPHLLPGVSSCLVGVDVMRMLP